MTLHVDHDVPIPADAKAVIVTQNLVAARYVELTPSYRTSGPVMADGAVIPVERTAVPVEWDEVKSQLMRLATDLGPNAKVSTPSISRFIDSAANALAGGNGEKLRQTLTQLSGVARTIANGSGNIVDIIKNLQIVRHRAARQQHSDGAVQQPVGHAHQRGQRQQIRSGRGADRPVERQWARCSDSSPGPATRRVSRLTDWARPSSLSSISTWLWRTFCTARRPRSATSSTTTTPTPELSWAGSGSRTSPIPCSPVCISFRYRCPAADKSEAIENVTSTESGKLCSLFLGPGLRVLNFNSLPIPDRSVHAEVGRPGQRRLQRSAPRTRRRGPEARTARNPARDVGVHRAER